MVAYGNSINHQLEAKQLRDLQANRINPDHVPTDLAEFQALVEKEPNCALNWIAYMAYYIKNSSIPEAVATGRQGLKVISEKEPDARLHVWSSLLKIEVSFYSNESTQKLFREAEQDCDTLKVYEVMADIYGDCGKFKEMELLLKKFTKTFSKDMKAWLMAGNMLFKYKLNVEAKALVDKGILSIPKKKHLQYTTMYGEMLMKYGDIEEGTKLFEKLLSHFPKKLNIWNIYVDKLIKKKEYKLTREALNSMCYLGLNNHKMKSVFKKFIDFEKKYGTVYTLEEVKKRVESYCSDTSTNVHS